MLFCCLGSSSEDSHLTTETDNVCDLVVSCSSASSRKKKRYHGIANDAGYHNGSKKIKQQKMEDNSDSNDCHSEEEVMRKANTFEEKRSCKIDKYELSDVSNCEDQLNEEQYQGNASNHNNSNVHRNEDNIQATKLTKKSKVRLFIYSSLVSLTGAFCLILMLRILNEP